MFSMFKSINSLVKVITNLVREEMDRRKTFEVFVVTDVNETDFTVNIKHAIKNTQQYDNVKVIGVGLGNFKGVVKLPDVDDFVLVGFIDVRTPIILGSLFSEFDVIPNIKNKELLIASQEKGATIFFDKDNNIKIKSGNALITVKDGDITITGGTLNLNGSDVGIARIGDSVQVTGVASGSNTVTGTITTGSSNVKTGST